MEKLSCNVFGYSELVNIANMSCVFFVHLFILCFLPISPTKEPIQH